MKRLPFPAIHGAALLTTAFGILLAHAAPGATPDELAQSYLQRGLAAETAGEVVAAENCFELALRVKPGWPTAKTKLEDLRRKFPPPDLLSFPAGPLSVRAGASLKGVTERLAAMVAIKSDGRLTLTFELVDPAGSLAAVALQNANFGEKATFKTILDTLIREFAGGYEVVNGAVVKVLSREALTAQARSASVASTTAGSSSQPTALAPVTVAVSFQGRDGPASLLNDGTGPDEASDPFAPAFTWRPRYGTLEWAEYRFATPTSVAGCEVLWAMKDGPVAEKRVAAPEHWKVLYLNEADEWWPVNGSADRPIVGAWNACRFSPVRAKGLRLMLQMPSGAAVGIHEWKILPGPGNPAPPPRPTQLRLDDMIPVTAAVGHGNYRVNKYSLTEERKGGSVLLDSAPCEHFLFAHASSTITFAVPAGFTQFTAIGISPSHISAPKWTYKVVADGTELFQSELLNSYPGNRVPVDVKLPAGCRTLTLITEKTGNGNLAHSIWAEPLLMRAPDAPLTWTSTDGKSIVATFVRLEGDVVVVLKEGKELKIPLARLNAESLKQAKSLGGATGAPAKPPSSADTKEPAAKPAPSPPTQSTPADEKLSSMARLRKLCEKVIAISPNGLRLVIDRRVLPQTSLPLPPGTFDIAEMNIGGASAAGFTDADFELLGAGRSATSVAVNDTAVTKLDALRAHRGLTSLSAEQTRIDDTALPALEPLRELTKVLFSRTQVSGRGLHHLRGCTKLQFLGLSGCPVTDDAMSDIAGMRSLEVLWLGTTKVTAAGLTQLGGHPKLRELNLDGLALQDGALDFVPSVRSLSALSFYTSQVSRGAFQKIAEAGALETLVLISTHIDGAPVGDTDLGALAAASKLNRLLLAGTAVTGTGFASLSKCRALKHVDMGSSTPVSDEGLAVMTAAVPGLEQLVIGGNLTAKGVSEVAKWRQLAELQISSETMDDVTVGALPAMRSLRRLELHGVKMGGQAAAAVGKQASLTFLNVSGTSFDDSAIPHLSRLGALRELVVGKCPFTEEGLSKLRRALPNCTVSR